MYSNNELQMEEYTMAKTIKFNLICDDKPVRTIEDLQDNFSIEDVLKYYQNGLLLRWLNVRGYEAEAKKVSEINATEDLEIIKELIKIFGVEADTQKVEEGVYMLKFLEERKVLYEAYAKDNFKVKNIIDDYQAGFDQLINGIIENPENASIIKANIAELMSQYKWIMDLNHRELFWRLQDISPLAIMCLLMNKEARRYYLPICVSIEGDSNEEDNNIGEIGDIPSMGEYEYGTCNLNVIYDIESDEDKAQMYKAICSMLSSSDLISKLGSEVHSFSGETDGYWKDLETKGKKYMILKMEAGDYVRHAGVQNSDLDSTDINNKFEILDGIDYKCKNARHQLLYMEV